MSCKPQVEESRHCEGGSLPSAAELLCVEAVFAEVAKGYEIYASGETEKGETEKGESGT